MKKITGKVILEAGIVAITLASVAYLSMLAINWRDQPVSGQAKELRRALAPDPEVTDQNNGFVYAIGLTTDHPGGPAGAGAQLAEVVGEQWGELEMPASRYWVEPGRFVDVAMREVEPEWPASVASACGVRNLPGLGDAPPPACADSISSDSRYHLEQEFEWLLVRYTRLVEFKHWQQVHAPRSPMPDFLGPVSSALKNGQSYYLLGALGTALKGRTNEAKSRFHRDARFWRLVLRESENLLWRAIAEIRLMANLLLLNQMVQALEPAQVMDSVPDAWREPLDQGERSLNKSLAGEMQIGRITLEQYLNSQAPRLKKIFVYPLLQLQATENALARWHDRRVEVSERPWPDLARWLGRDESVSGENLFPPHWAGPLYNPVGRHTFVGAENSAFRPYMATTAQVETARVAMLSAARIRARRVPAGRVAQHLRTQAAPNPLTLEPQPWDGEQKAIRVMVPGGVHRPSRNQPPRFQIAPP